MDELSKIVNNLTAVGNGRTALSKDRSDRYGHPRSSQGPGGSLALLLALLCFLTL